MFCANGKRALWLPLLVAFAASGCYQAASGARDQTGQAPDGDSFETRPVTECNNGECAVRVSIRVEGRTLVSDPLPFSATSSQTVPVSADASFGLGNSHDREIEAWSIGTEENSVGVALEMVAIGDESGVIAHQTAGFTHTKRAHIVLQITDYGLITKFEVTESPGPMLISVWPTSEGIAVETRFANEEQRIESYRWTGIGPSLSLDPVSD